MKINIFLAPRVELRIHNLISSWIIIIKYHSMLRKMENNKN